VRNNKNLIFFVFINILKALVLWKIVSPHVFSFQYFYFTFDIFTAYNISNEFFLLRVVFVSIRARYYWKSEAEDY